MASANVHWRGKAKDAVISALGKHGPLTMVEMQDATGLTRAELQSAINSLRYEGRIVRYGLEKPEGTTAAITRWRLRL